jgi:predicted kinase
MTGASTRAESKPGLLVVVTGVPGTGKSVVAEAAADMLGAALLAHDWAMSGLRPFPELQTALDAMEPPGHRIVGWSILGALSRAQLRRGGSVVVDGVARAPEIARCREIAQEFSVGLVVIMTQCSDLGIHRSRIEGRQRAIPNWYELDWAHVLAARAGWEPPDDVALCLEATDPWEDNVLRLRRLFGYRE